jgi:hypothetical protein
MNQLADRLNKVLDRLVSDDFLGGRGMGNEIGFHIFDYPPEHELVIRDHIAFLMQQIPKLRPTLRVRHVNLFDMVLEHLTERKLLDKVLAQARTKGDAALLKGLKDPLHGKKLAPVFAQLCDLPNHDLILVSGVGTVYPLVRTHSILNNLHHLMQDKPLVMFFPGNYDGQSLRLFGMLKDDGYYRAFRLVP